MVFSVSNPNRTPQPSQSCRRCSTGFSRSPRRMAGTKIPPNARSRSCLRLGEWFRAFSFTLLVWGSPISPAVRELAARELAAREQDSNVDSGLVVGADDVISSARSPSSKKSFSEFLHESGPKNLWLDDLLARWRRTNDASFKLQASIKICVWLEQELQQHSFEALQSRYPQVWSGPHAQDQAFAAVVLVEVRQQLNRLALVAFEDALRESPRNESLEALRDVQRRLRLTIDQFQQLQSENHSATLSRSVLQLQQLDELAAAGLAWSLYYEWLLTPSEQVADPERLQAATQIFMRLFGTTEPDMQPADWYKWFEPSRGVGNDGLLGLGLCLAALERTDVASTCFATLQRQSDPRLSQRVILFHAQNLLKRKQWEDARLLVSSYLQATRTPDPTTLSPMVETMLAWFHTAASAQPSDDGTLPTSSTDATLWCWKLVEQLVIRGQIDEAARLSTKYSIPNPGTGLAAQVLLLHSLLNERPLAERSTQQLAQLTERLRSWANVNEPANALKPPRDVQRWAQRRLTQVLEAMGEVTQARDVLLGFYADTPVEEVALRQTIALEIAQTYERDAATDLAVRRDGIRWYREAASHPNLAHSTTAEIKARLWELADRPIAQTAYLRSFLPSQEGYLFARRQLIARLHAELQAAPADSLQKSNLAVILEQEILQQLALPQLIEAPSPNDVPRHDDVPRIDAHTVTQDRVAWQKRLQECLSTAAQEGNDAGSAALVAIWLQTMPTPKSDDSSVLSVSSAVLAACVRHVQHQPQKVWAPWRPVLYAAAIAWPQTELLADNGLDRQTVVQYLLQSSLTPMQVHSLMAAIVPEQRRQWESRYRLSEQPAVGDDELKQSPATLQLQEFYRQWWSGMQARPPMTDENRWRDRLQLEYAEFLWRMDDQAAAKQVLESWRPVENDRLWRRQMARILLQLPDPQHLAEGERLWQGLAGEFPQGSQDWFEAKFYLLQLAVPQNPNQAKMVYVQLRALYPDFPAPWDDAYTRLAVEHRW